MKTVLQILQETATPAILWNESGVITHVNEAFMRLSGWTKKDAEETPLAAIIPGLREVFKEQTKTGLSVLIRRTIALDVCHKSGDTFKAEFVITAEYRNAKWVYAALVKAL